MSLASSRKYIILVLTAVLILFFAAVFVYWDAVFQEGNPLPVFAGILKLNGSEPYAKIKDVPETYIIKTGEREGLISFIEKEKSVKFKEQMGAGFMFEGPVKKVILVSRQYTRFFTLFEVVNPK